MQYYELLDPLRQGDVILTDGRKHFRFSFGPYQWERTTIFLPYLTEGTALFGKCREIDEKQALRQEVIHHTAKKPIKYIEKTRVCCYNDTIFCFYDIPSAILKGSRL